VIRIHVLGSKNQNLGSLRCAMRDLSLVARAASISTVVLLLASLAMAQATSSLNGSVTDPSGATVAGATLTLTAADTGLQRTTISNNAGLYQFLMSRPANTDWKRPAKVLLLFPSRMSRW
jgi:Carboxypeptidase regulatory-like domain